jgi:ABC-2 type transport system permease protein
MGIVLPQGFDSAVSQGEISEITAYIWGESLAKSLMSVFAWGMVAIIVLAIPAFGILFPGTISGWVQAIPSYYLVDTVHLAANFGFGWGEVWDNLLILLGFDVAIFGLGIWALRRKMR